MKLLFTKMQGAGNDFVVLDATQSPIELTPAQLRHLGDRRFGVGADQILMVTPSPALGIDFGYRIFNGATGDEVEQCGNGARCFARFVRHKGLSRENDITVQTLNSTLVLHVQPDDRVTVNMGAPVFELSQVPFDATGLQPRTVGNLPLWMLDKNTGVEIAVLSMGNPHAALLVNNTEAAPVATLGPLIEHHPRFARRVNVGFMQIVNRQNIKLRVFERDAGETLACGTGACAAAVAGMQMGLLDAQVEVQTRGGRLTIEWIAPALKSIAEPQDDLDCDDHNPVFMTGPADIVFEGDIEL
jgi:diaminopimelate epimerase